MTKYRIFNFICSIFDLSKETKNTKIMKNKTIIQKMEEERNNLLAQSKQLESVSKQLSDELKAMAKGVEVAMNIYAN